MLTWPADPMSMTLTLVLAACTPDPVELAPGDTAPGCDVDAQLATAEDATARFVDAAEALAAGYLAQPDCDADPSGAAMGIHYVKVAASLDQSIDLTDPDALLYVPDGDGVRLVGIEYVAPALYDGELEYAPAAPDDASRWSVAPELFCRPFDGPMEGHVPGQPWHYDLHVWLFSDNPDSLFAQYNPTESCDG